ncbi:MAG: Unknown protein [uncultured Aureispira sp.]|uniref:LTD domain-containing protein n=1 Tax=uncultured Aureispira sp. TaxID=1331704 RepID=A0A6S6S6K0_9BACT|nr:MAG: Unknown protein [uncultured Aureispira sp.]
MPILICLIIVLLGSSPIIANPIVITEIHHSPADGNLSLEFIELYNRSATAITLSDWQLTKGIEYRFPKGTVLEGGAYVVLSKNRKDLTDAYQLKPDQLILGPFKGRLDGEGTYCVLTNELTLFQQKYGFKADGTYQGKLSNKGEQLMLYNAFDELIDSVQYATYGKDEVKECTALELVYTRGDNALATNWSCAGTVQGTPGQVNSVFLKEVSWSRGYWLAFLTLLLALMGYGLRRRALFVG